MKYNNKKGQAAMEFLMTYGWAILAAIIAIGVLAYFGVFNPSRLAGSAAVLNAPMNVDAFNILADDASCTALTSEDCINLEITQNSGQTLDLSSSPDATIGLTSGGLTATAGCYADVSAITSWISGQSQTINFICDDDGISPTAAADEAFDDGSSIAGNIAISYRTAGGSTIDQTSTGNVRGVAQ